MQMKNMANEYKGNQMKLIASGRQADVFFDNSKAIKLFKYPFNKTEVEQEANLQKMAYEYGLPVPKIYETIELNGKQAIVMEYINGIPLGVKMLDDRKNAVKYIEDSVDIQIKIHKISTDTFPSMKEKQEKKIIEAKYLVTSQRENLLLELSKKTFENKLCHGDYHVNNLIVTNEGIKIIDWVDSTSGSPAADVYRTYLLYLLDAPEIAELYLNMYCKKTGINREKIIRWGPLVAGGKLSEQLTAEQVKIINEILK
jgi:aminoglycoside phosphotransferase (APT) family kinase protein